MITTTNPTTKKSSREEEQIKTLLPMFATSTFRVIRKNRFTDLLWIELDDSEKRAIYINMFDPCGLD